MKRKMISILLLIALIVGMLPMTAMADAASLNDLTFWLEKNEDAGLGGKVNIAFTKSGNDYSGTLYLPGSADTTKLSLSWDSDATVKVGETTYENGSAPIPAADASITYIVTLGGATANFTVTTMKGSSGVEGMFLEIDESMGTIAAMNGDSEHETECYGIVSYDGNSYDMSVKGRGNYSWRGADKKPYNITIFKDENIEQGIKKYSKKQTVSFIDNVESKKWSLLTNYSDSTLLRNKIGYDLAKSLGIGLDSDYVDIWMNGHYLGNYLLTPKTDYNAPKNGYLLELDNYVDTEDEQFRLQGLDAAAATSSQNLITIKDNGAGADAADVQAWMQTMLDAVMDYDSDEYLKYIDIDSWAKLYILQEFYKNFSILCGSIFMHRDGLTAEDKLIAGPVWDLDEALGRTKYSDHNGISREMQLSANGWYIDSIDGKTAFLQYLGKHSDFMQRVYEIYNEYKDAFAQVLTDIEQQNAIIMDSASMNFTRWDVNQNQHNASRVTSESTLGTGKYAYKQIVTGTREDYLTNLKSYVTNRLSFLSDNLTVEAPLVGSITGETTVLVGETLSLTADTTASSYQWQSSADGETWTDIADATAKTYSATMTAAMNGLQYRCVAKNTGSVINTSRVAKVAPSAQTILDPVTVSKTASLSTTSFFVDKNTDAGLGGKVNIAFTKSGNDYSGTLYLPGSADTTKLSLSWDSDATVKINGTSYNSGSAPIPAANASLTYNVTLGGATANFTVKTMKGSSGVEGMFLEIDETKGTIAAMNGDSTKETECFGTAAFDGTDNYIISMKGRGNVTWTKDKKPYNITFYKADDYNDKKKVELISGTKSKKWTILANTYEITSLRNKIGYDLADEMGVGLETRMIDIWMNGSYIGHYLLTPKNDYKASDTGFMLELDNKLEPENGDPQFTIDGLNEPGAKSSYYTRFTVKDIGKESGLDVSDIKAWITDAWNAIRKYDSDEYLQYIDLDSWAKMYLLQEYYKNLDIIAGSIFMSRASTDASDKLVAGPVWDLDHALGRSLSHTASGMNADNQRSANNWYIDHVGDSAIYNVSDYSCWLQELGKHKDFMTRVYEIYNEYASEINAIPSIIDSEADAIRDSMTMNYDRCEFPTYASDYVRSDVTYGSGTYALKYVKTTTWDNALTNLKTYTKTRAAFFASQLAVTAPTGSITGTTAVSVGDTLTLTADCTANSYQWQSSADGETWTDIADATAKTYSATAKITMNNVQFRCIATNTGSVIETTRVAKVAPSAQTILDPVTVTVSMEGHNHSYTNVVVTAPTCIEQGYTTRTCSCGDVVVDTYTNALNHNFVDGKCTRCRAADPDYVPVCITDKSVSLAEGKLLFFLGNQSLGEFTFAKSGNNWTIQDSDGQYLGFANKAFTYSGSGFGWNYSNGSFQTSVTTTTTSSSSGWGGFSWFFGGNRNTTTTTTTTYYLVYSGGNFTVSTSSNGSSAGFKQHIENLTHTFGSWTTAANGQHSRTCSVCNAVQYENCNYGEDHNCTVCGRTDPNLVYCSVSFVTGTSTVITSQSVISGETANNPGTLSRIGYLFNGWYRNEALFDFTAPVTENITLTANWTECTDHTYENDYCTKCGAKDPASVSPCTGNVSVSLSEGTLIFTLGGQELGEYTFARSGNNWSIQDSQGRFLGFANNRFTYSDSAFAWNYSNGRFQTSVTTTSTSSSGSSFGWFFGRNRTTTTTTTYYLSYSNSSFSTSTGTGNSNAAFAVYVENEEHTFGNWTSVGKGQHSRICSVCGETETEDCQYGENHRCPKCNAYDPSAATVEASVSISQRTSGSNSGFFGWFFGNSNRTTTYTATISSNAVGTTVKTVQYSTNNGSSWQTGSSFSSTNQITSFLIRVTDADNREYNFRFDGSNTTEIK